MTHESPELTLTRHPWGQVHLQGAMVGKRAATSRVRSLETPAPQRPTVGSHAPPSGAAKPPPQQKGQGLQPTLRFPTCLGAPATHLERELGLALRLSPDDARDQHTQQGRPSEHKDSPEWCALAKHGHDAHGDDKNG